MSVTPITFWRRLCFVESSVFVSLSARFCSEEMCVITTFFSSTWSAKAWWSMLMFLLRLAFPQLFKISIAPFLLRLSCIATILHLSVECLIILFSHKALFSAILAARTRPHKYSVRRFCSYAMTNSTVSRIWRCGCPRWTFDCWISHSLHRSSIQYSSSLFHEILCHFWSYALGTWADGASVPYTVSVACFCSMPGMPWRTIYPTSYCLQGTCGLPRSNCTVDLRCCWVLGCQAHRQSRIVLVMASVCVI